MILFFYSSGWSNGSSTYTSDNTTANLNPSNAMAVTVTAQWQKTVTNFDYTGKVQTFTATVAGYYKLEVWGGQGGTNTSYGTTRTGGYGGYSVGVYKAIKNTTLYINVGGQGQACYHSGTTIRICNGGYNGGGSARAYTSSSTGTSWDSGSGGGVTHIATVSGELKNLSAYKDTGGTNISKEILIVAGGGGAGGIEISANGVWPYRSADLNAAGGGYIGVRQMRMIGNATDCPTCQSILDNERADTPGYGGTQTQGGATVHRPETAEGTFFGYGEDRVHNGGGGGWYGGEGSAAYGSSGGGSGYIGSSNLISGLGVTKHMTCYSCITSTAANTRTQSNTTTPTSTPTADVARIGNGYARITWMGDTL